MQRRRPTDSTHAQTAAGPRSGRRTFTPLALGLGLMLACADPDIARVDAGASDGGDAAPEAGAMEEFDAAPSDAGQAGDGSADGGTGDAGETPRPDAGGDDAGSPDAGGADAAAMDASASDAAVDAGACVLDGSCACASCECASYAGTVSGDTARHELQVDGMGDGLFAVRVTEDDASPFFGPGLSVRVAIEGGGADTFLRLFTERDCAVVAASNEGAPTDALWIARPEDRTRDDSYDLLVEVHADSAATWRVLVTGNDRAPTMSTNTP